MFWRRPENTAARLLFLYYVTQVTIHVSWLLEPSAGHSLSDLLSPTSYALMGFFSHGVFGMVLAPLMLHLCLSFPEPKALARRFPWLLAVVYALPWLLLVGAGLSVPLLGSGLETAGYLLVGSYSLLGASALVHTFVTVRDPLRRAQVRWVAFGFAILSLHSVGYALGALSLLDGLFLNAVVALPSSLILTMCLAIAVLRHRLFDIDIVVNRTLLYGSLTACVVLLYVLVVGGVGALLGARGNPMVSLLGTGLVAVLFQPLRERLQRAVNRLLYGQRDEPYALLTRLSRQSETVAEPERVLPALVEGVAQALKLPYAAIFLYPVGNAEEPQVVAEYGALASGPLTESASEPLVFPLLQQGEMFGELRLGVRTGGFSAAELRLLTTISRQAAVAAYAARQTHALHRSRERLIAARETERLRLRRELHDGLGPSLAGLSLQLGALKQLLDQPAALGLAIGEVQGDLRAVTGEVRRIVYDLRPPSLDELGLRGAVEHLVQKVAADAAQPLITLELPELPDLPPATEVAAYRIIQEALTNALKHAHAQRFVVTARLGEHLLLILRDDGDGLPESYRAGVGLHSMRERAEALGGRFTVSTGPGTTIQVELPLPAGQVAA